MNLESIKNATSRVSRRMNLESIDCGRVVRAMAKLTENGKIDRKIQVC